MQQQLGMPHVLNSIFSDVGLDHMFVLDLFENSTFFISLQNENQSMWTEKRFILISVMSSETYDGEQDLLAEQMGKLWSFSWYIPC